MKSDKLQAVKSRWERTVLSQQKVLAMQFIELYGAIHNEGDWYYFLAEEFNIYEKI
ncbi:MAG: hypothetical protein HKP41_04210 [Desulfobacterales bacterium]|nr:hypothetical protein [Deltaproteobacteria bacterium]NNK93537.1 hypothetical protein [Desulfobacterales bacterium]